MADSNKDLETEEKTEATETEEAEVKEETEAEAAEETEEQESEDKAEQEENPEGEKKERELNWTKKSKKEAKAAKKAETEKLEAAVAEANDKYARLFAEFDNFRKRSEKEKASMYTMGAKAVIEKMLPIVDSFERGLATLSDEEKESPFAAGMDKVYKQLEQSLTDLGVTPIEAVGQEFNPDFHNAVMHVEDESVGENIVVEEFQKGYMYKDSVIRFSMVKVAN